MTVLVEIEGAVKLYQFTPEEMAQRDDRLIKETIAGYIKATSALPDATETVSRADAAAMLKISANYVHTYCKKNGITWADRANGHYRYHKLSIVNHLNSK